MSFAFEPIQALESRRMLSAAAFHHGHTLVVRGDEHAANTIVVKPNAENTAIDVSIQWTSRKGVAKSLTASFPKTLNIRDLRVRGGKEADSITIEQAPAPAPTTPVTATSSRSGKDGRKVLPPFDGVIDARVYGHAGNDTITTGAGDDKVKAGRGDDVVDTGAGNDTVQGQRGNDLLKGGDGNDNLWGGVGDDTVEGGNGDDKLGGVLGVNTLTGGAGKDTFVVRTLTGQTTDYNNTEDVLVTVPTKADKGSENDDSEDDDDKHGKSGKRK